MKADIKTDNYEKMICDWQARFLGMDHRKLLHKLPEIRDEGTYFSLVHFGQKCGIEKGTGKIVPFNEQETLSLWAKCNIYTLLWYCTDSADPTGEWVPFKTLKGASPFAPAYQKTVLDVFSRTFAGQTEALAKACGKLDGKKLSHGDIGYQINAFDCMPVRFLFWDADDEFPAQSNILFDKNATDLIHVESIVTIASEGISRLTKEAGLSVKGDAFVQNCPLYYYLFCAY